jgi:FAD/FMN-containing dehydrogenase
LKREAFARHRPLKHELGRAIKAWLDPHGLMNPGVVFDGD